MRAFKPWAFSSGGRIGEPIRQRLMAIACIGFLAALPVQAADQPAAVTADAAAPAVAQTAAPTPAQQHRPVLEQRITLMAAELGLDERQRTELRKILINQRMQVMKLWNDTTVPAASRVGATRVISEQTGDQIRALLNDEQKAKYNHPRKPRDATADPGARSVEDWMNAASRN